MEEYFIIVALLVAVDHLCHDILPRRGKSPRVAPGAREGMEGGTFAQFGNSSKIGKRKALRGAEVEGTRREEPLAWLDDAAYSLGEMANRGDD